MTEKTKETEIGPVCHPDGTLLRVWAPRCNRVHVVLSNGSDVRRTVPLHAEADGVFSTFVDATHAGARYGFRLDDDERVVPDPASHFQPEGVHALSQLVDPSQFRWSDTSWPGVRLKGQVIYELHIGTFTPEGTWRAASTKLPLLADVGITLIEVMPVAEFSGDFGWGYDGVYWFAPTRLYGRPDDFRAFVDTAHALGIGVILDVVYNHFGPRGFYGPRCSSDYFASSHHTAWGDAINYDGKNCSQVRNFVANNASYWIREFHLDGLRFDATDSIFDDSPKHILADVSEAARRAAGGRSIVLIAENEHQNVRHIQPVEQGGFGFDAMWNDDFHHTARVAATGRRDGYYAAYAGSPQELISTARWGFLYQGQWNVLRGRPRGTAALSTTGPSFINFLENHDQVSNSEHGLRPYMLTSPGRWRALTALLLLAPGTPMLFMGQEFLASTPFPYFADQEPDIAHLVRAGRWDFLCQFKDAAAVAKAGLLPDPADRTVFERSKLDWSERDRNYHATSLHRDLLRLRREDLTFAAQDERMLHGAVLGGESFLLRWVTQSEDDRVLVVNLGEGFAAGPRAEPLLAPPVDSQWQVIWSSEDPRYGGEGVTAFDNQLWRLSRHSAIVLAPVRRALG